MYPIDQSGKVVYKDENVDFFSLEVAIFDIRNLFFLIPLYKGCQIQCLTAITLRNINK